MQLALNVGAMLLAFIALIALLNGILSGVGGWFNHPELSLQMILGWIFSPLAWVIGVPWHEATVAGSFIGQKLIINEFVAYMNFGEYLKADAEVAAAGCRSFQITPKPLSLSRCAALPTCHRSPF